MIKLFRLGVVRRFDPPTAIGSSPMHYMLDVAGARIVAAERGIPYRELGWRRDNGEGSIFGDKLRHHVETNGFFTCLIQECRNEDQHCVSEWRSEKTCRRLWGEAIRPDGYALIVGPEGACSFLIEYDRGTESPGRVAAKLPQYDGLGLVEDGPDVLVLCFPDPEREASVRKRLYSVTGLVVATTSLDRHAADPLGPVWLPIGSEQRASLIELPRLRDHGGTR